MQRPIADATGRLVLPIDFLLSYAERIRYPAYWRLAFEGDKATEGRIREAVLPGFDVTRQPVFEGRV